MGNSPLLDEKIIVELREKLESEKDLLEKELAAIADRDPNAKGDWKARYVNTGDDWDDNAQEVTEYATNLPLEHTLEERLDNIKSALDKIEKNSYGFCEFDQKPIPLERLRANPSSKTCLEHSK